MPKFISEHTVKEKLNYFFSFCIPLILILTQVGCEQNQPSSASPEEKEKGILLIEKIKSTNDMSERIVFAEDVLNYAKETGNDSLQYEAFFKLGIIYLMKSNLDTSQFYLNKAKQGFKEQTYQSRELVANASLMVIHKSKDEKEAVSELILASDRIIANHNKPNEDYIFYYIQKMGFYYYIGMQDSTLATANYADSLANAISSVKYEPQLKSVKGAVYAFLGNDSLAITNYKATLPLYEPYEHDKAIIFTNLGNAYARLENVDSSLYYFKQAQHIYETTGASEPQLNKLKMDIAYALSDVSPTISKSFFEVINPELLPAKNKFYYYDTQKKYATSLSNRIKGTEEALAYLKTLELPYKKFEVTCYYDLYNDYAELGNYKNALINFELYNNLNEEMKSEEIALEMQTSELISRLKLKDQKILNQELMIAKKGELLDTQEHRLYLAVILAILILVVLAMLIQSIRRKGKITKLKLKQKRLQQKLLIQEMDPIAFQLGSAKETIEIVKQKLTALNEEEVKSDVNQIKIVLNQWLHNFNEKQSTKSAQKLIESDFLDKLQEFPDLTESEKNVIILIKQGYKTKEISDRLNLAQNTVEIYRSRIRKKLNIPQKEHLSEMISKM